MSIPNIALCLTFLVCLTSVYALASPTEAGGWAAVADETLEPDPEDAEGNFEERARSIQRWLQKRELERIDMGLSHQYERPRSLNDDDDDDEETSSVPTIRGFRRSGRDLYVRLRRPGSSEGFGSRSRHSARGRGGKLWLRSVSHAGGRGGSSRASVAHALHGQHYAGKLRTGSAHHASSSRSGKRNVKRR